MFEQLPAHAAALVVRPDANRDLACFHRVVTCQHRGGDDRRAIFGKREKIFLLPMIDIDQRGQTVMANAIDAGQKAESQIVRRHVREQLGERRFIVRGDRAHMKCEPRPGRKIAAPTLDVHFRPFDSARSFAEQIEALLNRSEAQPNA